MNEPVQTKRRAGRPAATTARTNDPQRTMDNIVEVATKEFAESLEGLVQFHAAGKITELISTYERLRALDKLSPENRRRLARHNLTVGRTAAARDLIASLLQATSTAKG